MLRGMTQPQLGAKAGITTQTVSCVERGVISLSDSVAQKKCPPRSEFRKANCMQLMRALEIDRRVHPRNCPVRKLVVRLSMLVLALRMSSSDSG